MNHIARFILFSTVFSPVLCHANFEKMARTQYVIENWDDEIGQFIIRNLKSEFGPSYGFEHAKVRQFMESTLDKNRNLQLEVQTAALYRHHDIVFTYLIFKCWHEEPVSKTIQAFLFQALVLALETCDDMDIDINKNNYGGFADARGYLKYNHQQLRPLVRLIQIFNQHQKYTKNLVIAPPARCRIYNLLNEQAHRATCEPLATWFETAFTLALDNNWVTLNQFVDYLFNPQFYRPKPTYPAGSFLRPVIHASEKAHGYLFPWFCNFTDNLTLEGLCQLDCELQKIRPCPLAEKNYQALQQKLEQTRSHKYNNFVMENGEELAITTYGQMTSSGFQLSARFRDDKTPELLENQAD